MEGCSGQEHVCGLLVSLDFSESDSAWSEPILLIALFFLNATLSWGSLLALLDSLVFDLLGLGADFVSGVLSLGHIFNF